MEKVLIKVYFNNGIYICNTNDKHHWCKYITYNKKQTNHDKTVCIFCMEYTTDCNSYSEHPICRGDFFFLTHWARDKMAAIFQTIFSNALSWMKTYQFRLRFHCIFSQGAN